MTRGSGPLLPLPPDIAGLWFRTYRDETDLPAIVEVLRAADEANGETMVVSIDRVRNHYRNMSRIDPREDVLLGFVGDRLVANSFIEWADTAYGERHFNSLGAVHPDWRRLGIGAAMAERNETRLREVAASLSFEQTPVLTTWMQDGDVGGSALARARGYRKVRVFHHMVRPHLREITVPPLPDGLEVRPLTTDMLPRYWDAMCEAFRDHFGAWDASEQAFRSWVESPLFDLELQVVAFDGDEIAGGIHGAIDPVENQERGYLRGWSEPIFTRRPWRRRGLAQALLGRTLTLLRDRGMTSAQLHVDAENSSDALRLYQRHAFRVESSSSEWHKPLENT
jgi:mycothiol synthase